MFGRFGIFGGSSNNAGSLSYNFLIEDDAEFVDGRFPSAVVEFEALFAEAFPQVAIGESFASSISESDGDILVPSALTLDLVPRFVPDVVGTEFDPTINDDIEVNRDQIEYTFVDSEGEQDLQDVFNATDDLFTEITFIVRDLSDDPGFQFLPRFDENDFPPFSDFDPELGSSFFSINQEQASTLAINDIDFILDNNLLVSATEFRQSEDISFGLINNAPITLTIEAEDLNLVNYREESVIFPDSEESESFEVISLMDAPGNTGSASLIAGDFGLESGTYDLELSVFDENDGEASIDVLLNGNLVQSDSIELNEENTSSDIPTEDIRREFEIQGIEITNPSDIISIIGRADGTEWARVDFLTFTEVEA